MFSLNKKRTLSNVVFLMLSVCFIFIMSLSFCRAEDSKTLIKLEKGAIKILLPADWQTTKYSQEQQEKLRQEGVFMRDNPKALLGISIYSMDAFIKEMMVSDCQALAVQKLCLDAISKAKKDSPDSNWKRMVEEKNIQFFNNPALLITRENDIGKVQREMVFIKNCKIYVATLIADRIELDRLWPKVEESLKTMEFIK